MIIQSKSSIVEYSNLEWSQPLFSSYGLRFYDDFNYDYATIYRSQPNVRVCVDFLARNIAQLGLHVYRRLENDDRERLRDHPLAILFKRPLPPEYKVTRYKLISSLVSDLGVYYNAYLLKIRQNDRVTGLLRIPPYIVTVKGGLVPQRYQVDFSSGSKDFKPSEIIHFHGYNPESSIIGLSPLETLRRVLAEEHAMGDYREHFWKNAARMSGIIERPLTAPAWSDAARQRFKQEFEALYSGSEGSGKTAILEDGMGWKQASFSAQESEYLSGRKLTREECARAYHIPPPLVGILDHATFSNIKEQHKSLYTDTLGPWLAQIEDDFEIQLLPEFEDSDGVYCEFNIAEKLQGDFTEQANSFQQAVGRPWMTANEARSRMNLPRIEGGDDLVTPLNVMVGDLPMASLGTGDDETTDAQPIEDGEPKTKAISKGIAVLLPHEREKYTDEWKKMLTRLFNRQQASLVSKVKMAPDPNALWDGDRWNSEATEDFAKLGKETWFTWADAMASELGYKLDGADYENWLYNNARIFAEKLNQSTFYGVEEAMRSEDPLKAIKDLFGFAVAVRAGFLAASRVTQLSNSGTWMAARDGGAMTKTWMLGAGSNHRDSHIAVAGETVGIRERFSNGLRYPGDYQGSAEETVNCGCYLKYGR